MIPYGRQQIDEDDIQAVVETLRSDYLTTGPKVAEFEAAVARYTGAAQGVAVNSGTAALHAAVVAAGIGPGDEVIVPPMTFAASANAVVYAGGIPVFADVQADTLLLDPVAAAAKVTPRTKAIVAVDYAGQPCGYAALRDLCVTHGLTLIADGCHALGAESRGQRVGTLADLTCFSFHPVKHLTTGEGGMVVTDRDDLATAMRRFRNHGIATDYRQREAQGAWFYEMTSLGWNYRLTDFQCALGISQLRKLPAWLDRRRQLAARYDAAFAADDAIRPLAVTPDVHHAYHLYVVRVPGRDDVFRELRGRGIGVNVHYVPVHLHPFYRERFGTGPGLCPVAEAAYAEILSLPMFPGLADADQDQVVAALRETVAKRSRP
jgi:perosamine synthetase